MSNFWKAVLWIGGALWAALAIMATVPAGDAVSNLQSWADLFGLTALAKYLAHKGVDYAALGFIVGQATLTIIMTVVWLRWRPPPSKEEYDRLNRMTPEELLKEWLNKKPS